MATIRQHNGYLLSIGTQAVEVYDGRATFADRPIFIAPSIDKAKAWIDAYRIGYQWAIDARIW